MLLRRIETPSGSYTSRVCLHRLHIGRTCGCSPPSPKPAPTENPAHTRSIQGFHRAARCPTLTINPDPNSRTKTHVSCIRTNEDAHTAGN